MIAPYRRMVIEIELLYDFPMDPMPLIDDLNTVASGFHCESACTVRSLGTIPAHEMVRLLRKRSIEPREMDLGEAATLLDARERGLTQYRVEGQLTLTERIDLDEVVLAEDESEAIAEAISEATKTPLEAQDREIRWEEDSPTVTILRHPEEERADGT